MGIKGLQWLERDWLYKPLRVRERYKFILYYTNFSHYSPSLLNYTRLCHQRFFGWRHAGVPRGRRIHYCFAGHGHAYSRLNLDNHITDNPVHHQYAQ